MNMRPSIIMLCLGFVLVGIRANAQQDPLFAMYRWNTSAVDPAYAGSADVLSATLLAREQWVGLEGAPSTQAFTVHTPLPMQSLAVGLSFVHDRTGPSDNTQAFGDVAYRIRVSAKARLAFGLKAGVEMMQVRLAGLRGVDPADPLFQQDVRAKAAPNFGAGLYYWTARTFIGIGVPKLVEHDQLVIDGTEQRITGVRQSRHYFLLAGHVFDLGHDLKFHPSVLVGAVEGAPASVDLTLAFLLKEKLWLGATYRHPQSAEAFLAYQFDARFRVGYAYGSTWGVLLDHQSGTHEVMLGYDLFHKGERTLSPRYF